MIEAESLPKPTRRERFEELLGAPRECYVCGLNLDPQAATVDHIVPRGRGGTDARENRAWAHERCNQLKGNLTLPELVDLCRLILAKHG